MDQISFDIQKIKIKKWYSKNKFPSVFKPLYYVLHLITCFRHHLPPKNKTLFQTWDLKGLGVMIRKRHYIAWEIGNEREFYGLMP